jgi:hypothetical protein
MRRADSLSRRIHEESEVFSGVVMDQSLDLSRRAKPRKWSAGEIVVANVPSMLTYILGTLIMFHLGILFGVLYIAFVTMQLVLFMRFVCIYCPTYDSIHCPSGYGRVAAKLFKKGEVSQFKRMFNRFIPFLSLVWVVPVVGALVLIFTDFSYYYLGLLISFIVVGYIILPLFHRHFECRDCPNKENCPWGK